MADIVYPEETPAGTLGTELLPVNFDLKLWRGDHFPFSLELRNPDGTPMDLTGYTAQGGIRSIGDPSTFWPMTATIDNLAGTVHYLLTTATAATIPAGEYVWDVQTTDPSGNVRTHVAGDVVIHEQATV